jgi:diguanylate cyclase (GGDEF)-like protein
MFGSASVLLVMGAIFWEPGRNPRWVITSLAAMSLLFVTWAMVRGSRFTRGEALVLAAVQLFVVGALTWTTELMLAAFANGTVLPIIGAYVIWFLHPIAGRGVMLVGAGWWFAAIVQQDNSALVPFALSLLVQTFIAIEVLSRIKRHMDQVARTDPLTGVMNRRGVTEILEHELAKVSRGKQNLCVVAIDLDGLRTINNTLGHIAGDDLLERSSRHWSERMRRRDAIGRIGGDEFLFVLPRTSIEEADQLMQRLAETSPGAWSAGVAMAVPGETVESILERADRQMYVQKAARQSVG